MEKKICLLDTDIGDDIDDIVEAIEEIVDTNYPIVYLVSYEEVIDD